MAYAVIMGIKVEFNPDIALRNIREFKEGRRLREECISEMLEIGKIYDFLKEGQRLYWLEGELPLVETEGGGKLSKPLASVTIVEVGHFIRDGKVWTKGMYKVHTVFDKNSRTFEGSSRL